MTERSEFAFVVEASRQDDCNEDPTTDGRGNVSDCEDNSLGCIPKAAVKYTYVHAPFTSMCLTVTVLVMHKSDPVQFRQDLPNKCCSNHVIIKGALTRQGLPANLAVDAVLPLKVYRHVPFY